MQAPVVIVATTSGETTPASSTTCRSTGEEPSLSWMKCTFLLSRRVFTQPRAVTRLARESASADCECICRVESLDSRSLLRFQLARRSRLRRPAGSAMSGRSFSSSSSGNWSPRLRSSCMVFFQSMVPPSPTSGNRWRVALAVVVVNVSGADPLLHEVERRLDALVHVGVAGVEDVVQAEVRQLLELQQPLGARQLVGDVLQQDLDAALPREDAAALRARKTPRRTCACRTLRRPRPCAGSGSGTGSTSAISSARLISSTISRRCAFTGSVMVMTACGPERPQISSLYMGECSECSFSSESRNQWPELGDLRLVAIVQVLARAEDLHGGDPGLLDPATAARRSAGD